MRRNKIVWLPILLISICLTLELSGKAGAENAGQGPISLKTMGSLYFGGTVSRAADGETFHGDHGYAQY